MKTDQDNSHTQTETTTATKTIEAHARCAYLGHLPALAALAPAVREVLPERGEGHVDELHPVPLPLVPSRHRHSRHSAQSRSITRRLGQAAGAHQVRGEAQRQLVDGVGGASGCCGGGEAEVEVEVELVVRDGVVVEVQPSLAMVRGGKSLLRGDR